ncbi:MAG: hypothetical protein FDZ75_06920 [Actinobacteria bacterium]|nr:MAG: hypothetical protein FDZ75_06920 [Actinomycetota bacterium]
MNLGLPVLPPALIIVGGVTLLLLITFQMLVGYRKIHFQGRTHLKVHKTFAWILIAVAAVHALGGLLLLGIIR